ncbi:MAG: protein TolQ [Pseudomonadota bacterium]
METDLSYWELILNASILVQIVMILLVLASLVSWAVIFEKRKVIRRARTAAEEFEGTFWSGGDLSAMYRQIVSRDKPNVGMEGIFEGGFREFSRLTKKSGLQAAQIVEGARRAMRVVQMKEIDSLEHNLSMLATIGSTSPYVGLFGTVIGIMNAFRDLSTVQQATLQSVAPGIAEALIATAMGLFAAIPAVMAYNRYADQVDRLEKRYDTFIEEFSTIVQRHTGR